MDEFSYAIQLQFCEESVSAMCSTVHNIEVDRAAYFVVCTFEFVGLVDRHLWVLVTVK